jgi:hypothetical protein
MRTPDAKNPVITHADDTESRRSFADPDPTIAGHGSWSTKNTIHKQGENKGIDAITSEHELDATHAHQLAAAKHAAKLLAEEFPGSVTVELSGHGGSAAGEHAPGDFISVKVSRVA